MREIENVKINICEKENKKKNMRLSMTFRGFLSKTDFLFK